MDEGLREYIPELMEQEERFLQENRPDMRTYSPLTLAFIGDAVFSLYIRTVVVAKGNTAPGKLHKRCSELVKASAQASMIRGIYGELTREEQDIYRRGRNAQASSRAKNATMSEYRHATGLEALFGYLYLSGRGERMTELVEKCLEYQNGRDSHEI